ncbi:uncharacterized protein YpuA (DUF1002 family) [Bacillus mesophilus]|uniref:DUF1002 domain-containing protein n=1 Tax=Bacillus mesophilus TaxID=1808955 RepID=A0A6M0Q4K8_9BACI|nr:DUF1002 domain-containing protein [Bacillus mesophilus]MBM7661156.1 uncharacterized protein YpuA (DUF1002 family) [Bacillus mesophilus]NEY71316.1 DUF1002 domain-containing protein [Bacillus mesophilus]
MKKHFSIFLVLVSLLTLPVVALADAVVGDQVVTLGENLTEEQKKALLSEMEAPEGVEIITVTNEEEHTYLGDYIPKAQIGSKAISSSIITIAEPEAGLQVKANNITWVTEDMYTNALITAGVKDATIYITAPFQVSGTAALTGLLKAYELSSDQVIPEDVKKVANEEMVKTAELGDKLGTEQAAALMALIKEEIAKNAPQTDADLRAIIEAAAAELGLTLTEEDINSLIALFNKMKELNIDWNQVGEQLNIAKEKLTTFLQSEEGQTFLTRLQDFIASVFDAIRALFS